NHIGSIDDLLSQDIFDSIGLAVDLAGLHGSGSGNQPTGVIATSGIGDVPGSTDGLAPTWANIVALQSNVANNNGLVGNSGYVTNSKVRGALKTTLKIGSTFPEYLWDDENPATPLNGERCVISNQVSS